jgi:hypothetical protein
VAGGFVAGGLVTGAVAGVGTVVGAGAVTVAVEGVAVVEAARVVVVAPTGFAGLSLVELFEASTANAMPAMNKTTTTDTAIVVQAGRRWCRDALRAGSAARTTGRTAVGSSARTTGTGSVGCCSGGYQRPSECSHHPGSSGR